MFGAIIRHIQNSAQLLHIQPCHIQNLGLFRTRAFFKSLSNMPDDQAHSKPWHSQTSLFKRFQGYLGIFRILMHTQPHSHARNKGLVGGGEASPAPFENRKKVP